METFTMIWGTVSVGIAPVLQWLKSKIPADIPSLSFILAILFNGVSVYVIAWALKMPWDLATFWPTIADGALLSMGVHALTKSADKAGINVPLMSKNDHSS